MEAGSGRPENHGWATLVEARMEGEGGARRNATSRRPRGEAVGWMGWQQDGPGRMAGCPWQDGRMGMTWWASGELWLVWWSPCFMFR